MVFLSHFRHIIISDLLLFNVNSMKIIAQSADEKKLEKPGKTLKKHPFI